MSVLRVYDPAECDGAGVPLDWEWCRTCEGRKWYRNPPQHGSIECPICDGHGSLKAAALVALAKPERHSVGGYGPVQAVRGFVDGPSHRCEDCGHPMSEGTWEGGPLDKQGWLDEAEKALREGREPGLACVHFSPCDEGCDHDGPGRFEHTPGNWQSTDDLSLVDGQQSVLGWKREASWRPVDVRTLGWAHDLRPEKLAVLCLRCFAARVPAHYGEGR